MRQQVLAQHHACHNFQRVPVIDAASNKIILNIGYILGVRPEAESFFSFFTKYFYTMAIHTCQIEFWGRRDLLQACPRAVPPASALCRPRALRVCAFMSEIGLGFIRFNTEPCHHHGAATAKRLWVLATVAPVSFSAKDCTQTGPTT